MDHNLYVQLAGRKRFVITPPSQHWRLHYYPRLHPLTRKSQVDFDQPNFARTPRYAATQSLEAVLGPGDLLYMPPYWTHKVGRDGFGSRKVGRRRISVFLCCRSVQHANLRSG